jgi:integrase
LKHGPNASTFRYNSTQHSKLRHRSADPGPAAADWKPEPELENDTDVIRLRALIFLWRAGLRVSDALALTESDLDLDRGAVLIRHTEKAASADQG